MGKIYGQSLDELINELNKEHGIIVGKKDPIFVMHRLNAWLAEHNAEEIKGLMLNFRDYMEQTALMWDKGVDLSTSKSIAAWNDAIDKKMVEVQRKIDNLCEAASVSIVKSSTEESKKIIEESVNQYLSSTGKHLSNIAMQTKKLQALNQYLLAGMSVMVFLGIAMIVLK